MSAQRPLLIETAHLNFTVSSKAVQQALGHATHAMTVDLYGDAIVGTERQVARDRTRVAPARMTAR